MSRKGVNLSLETMVVAVLILVVMVIVIAIVTGQFQDVLKRLGLVKSGSCSNFGGSCVPESQLDSERRAGKTCTPGLCEDSKSWCCHGAKG